MKRMRELISKIDDSGLSFVEVLITMAIMAVVGTTVAGAMYVSSRSYTRGAAEVNVQEEAQVALNLISDWVMDATAVENPDGTTLKITHPDEGVVNTITVYQSGKQLMYKVDSDPTAYVLCDYLEDSGVHFDSTFDTDRNVKVSLDFNINGRTYHAATDSTSRNHDFTLNSTGSDVLNLVVPDSEIVLEPGMTGSAAFSFEAVVYGASSAPTISKSDETGDFDYSVGAVTASGPSTYKCTITVACRQYAMNDGSFKLTASYTEGGTTFTDTEIITTRVRRVTKCEYQTNDKGYVDPITGPADAGKSGSVYLNTVDLGALNWAPRLSSAYDQGTYAYVDPLHVEFYVRYADGTAVSASAYTLSVVDHGTPNPSVQITLNQNITKDIKVYVSAIHSGSNSVTGTNTDNKPSRILGGDKPYTTSGSAYVSYFMIKKSMDDPIEDIGAGFQRGSHAFRLGKLSDTALTAVNDYLSGVDSTQYWQVVSFRYKKEGEPDSAYSDQIYVNVRQGNEGRNDWALWGNASSNNQEYLADIFDCAYAYHLEVSYDLVKKSDYSVVLHYDSEGTVNAANQYVYDQTNNEFVQTASGSIGSQDNPVIVDKNHGIPNGWGGVSNNFYVYYDSYNCHSNAPYKIVTTNGIVEKYTGPTGAGHPTTAELNDPNNWAAATKTPSIQGSESVEIGSTIHFHGSTDKTVGGFAQNSFPDIFVTVVKNECGAYQNSENGLYRVTYYTDYNGQRANVASRGAMPSASNPSGSTFTMTLANSAQETLGTVYYEIKNF